MHRLPEIGVVDPLVVADLRVDPLPVETDRRMRTTAIGQHRGGAKNHDRKAEAPRRHDSLAAREMEGRDRCPFDVRIVN